MITRSRKLCFFGVKRGQARKADKLTAICEPISRRFEILSISQTSTPPRPITGIALLFYYNFTVRRGFTSFYQISTASPAPVFTSLPAGECSSTKTHGSNCLTPSLVTLSHSFPSLLNLELQNVLAYNI
jgi:hypothetical protein